MILQDLQAAKLIHAPSWLPLNTHYLTVMGSVAYGVSSDTSDMDVYGFCIPEKSLVFPHLAGEIPGFGRQVKRFEQWQEHGIVTADKTYDFAVYSIVRYLHLLMENNPNLIDSIFTPVNCVIHITQIGQLVRDSRNIFLHKGCFHKFRGYAFAQMHKMGGKNPVEGSKRAKLREQHGFDTKFAYHVHRLADECLQILTLGDLDLQRSKEYMKAIRRGEVTEEEIRAKFAEQEITLEQAYRESKLPEYPDEARIKALLLQCLEQHYGSLDKLGYVCPTAADDALRAIRDIIARHFSH